MRSWQYRYRTKDSDKRLRRVTLGHYPTVSLAEARDLCAAKRQVRREHGDVRAYEAERLEAALAGRQADAAEADRKAYTVAALVDEAVAFMDGRTKPRTWQEAERILRKELIPALGDVPAEDVRRRDVAALVEAVAKRGKGVQANRTLSWVRRAFAIAVKAERLEYNPAAGVEAPHKEAPRSRVLTDTELRGVLRSLDGSGLTELQGDVFLLALLTGCRLGEVVRLRPEDVALSEALWTLPTSKNRNPHRVLLSPQAFAIVARRVEGAKAAKSPWCFPGVSGSHYRVDSMCKAVRLAIKEKRIRALPFTVHDLRRTFATWAGEEGATEEAHDRLFNHKPRGAGMRGVYDHASRDRLARDWWERWGAHVGRLQGAAAAVAEAAGATHG